MSNVEPRRPSPDDRDAWYAYWKALGMAWRRQPEISAERQHLLAGRRGVQANIERGIYPFRDESGGLKLSRADIEWLLAANESNGTTGPVDWNDTRQRERESLDLRGADLRFVDLHSLPLARIHAGPNLREWLNSTPGQREMMAVHLEGASLFGANLEGAILNHAHLEGADLTQAHLEAAFVGDAHLEGARVVDVDVGTKGKTAITLWPADLREAFFDSGTKLIRTTLGTSAYGFVSVLDAHWNDANLAAAQWVRASRVRPAQAILGEERKARQRRDAKGILKDDETRLREYEEAVRANRQLAISLRSQGLSEDADHFSYRAQRLQRMVLRRQRQFGRALGSWLLDLVAGYGYKPMRSFLTYLLVVLGFAAAYFALGGANGKPLTWNEAIVVSMTAFHGRGFFAAVFQPGDIQAAVAAVEAFVGLLIEIVFIATFTQRFFAR